MAESVDSVVLQLEAKLGSYNADVLNAANASEKNLARIKNAASDTEKSVGLMANNSRISSQILMRAVKGMGDQFASGAPPMMLFTTHLGEFAEAAAYGGASLGKLGAFMQGPWGIAAAVGAQVLIPLIANLFKTGDSVDDLVRKLQEHFQKTQQNEQAQRIFARTLEGETQAAEENAKAVAGLALVHETAAEKALREAEATRLNTIETRKNTIAKLEAAKAAAQILINSTGAGVGVEREGATAAGLQSAQAQIDKLTKDLAQANANLASDEKSVLGARAGLIVERANETAEQKINRLYDKRIDDASKLAVAQNKIGDALQRQVDKINEARKADLERLKDADKTGHTRGSHYSNAETGRELTFAEAQAIAEGAGFHVNSAFRSTAHQAELYSNPAVNRPGNPVARPGSSAHEGANGRWALDIQLGPGVTPELLRKVFAAQGVTLSKVFKEDGHYHIEGQRSQAEVQANREAEQAQKAAEQEQKRYDTAKARLTLEAELEHLRASGNLDDAKRADILQSDYEIESQFPDLAKSTEKADRDRLQVLKDIADAAINEEYARKEAEKEAKRQKSIQDQLAKIGEEGQQAIQRGLDEQLRHEAEQIRTLANFYQDAFTGGTHAIWDDFKRVGLEVVAEVLAKFTLAQLSGNGHSFNLGSALTTALGAALPGFASGGSIAIGGRGGVDQNILSLNGQPMARVSAGEVLSIGNQRLGPSGGATVIQHISVDARNSVNPEGFAQQILAVSGQQAQQAAAQMGQRFIKAVPQRMASYQRDGF